MCIWIKTTNNTDTGNMNWIRNIERGTERCSTTVRLPRILGTKYTRLHTEQQKIENNPIEKGRRRFYVCICVTKGNRRRFSHYVVDTKRKRKEKREQRERAKTSNIYNCSFLLSFVLSIFLQGINTHGFNKRKWWFCFVLFFLGKIVDEFGK